MDAAFHVRVRLTSKRIGMRDTNTYGTGVRINSARLETAYGATVSMLETGGNGSRCSTI
jgi:hypothetical protein